MKFTKMHGLGNDYIYLDLVSEVDIGEVEAIGWAHLARKVSDRHFGIGSDGLVAILPSQIADFRMRIFNADGSEGEMCGNGIRCAGKLIHDHGLSKKTHLHIETRAGIRELDLILNEDRVSLVKVDMGEPHLQRREIPMSGKPEEGKVIEEKITVNERQLEVTALSMGNPHCVTFVQDIANAPVTEIGPQIEHHSLFPQRTNVEFIEVNSRNQVKMRVWERGSGETMACGTGACAAVVAGVLTGRTDRKVKVHLRGGILTIEWDETTGHVYMIGTANEICRGELSPEFLSAIRNQ